VIDFAGRDIALMALQFESSVRLAGEHPALLVLAVGRNRKLIEEVSFSSETRQLLNGSIGRGGLIGLRSGLSGS
jgi:hypothetical protein